MNPVLPTQESVGRGRASYVATCAVCHGDAGRGDGPGGAALPKKPADLVVHVPLHSDQVLFNFIQNGILPSGMPAQKGNLSEQQTWDLVNYLRTLASGR